MSTVVHEAEDEYNVMVHDNDDAPPALPPPRGSNPNNSRPGLAGLSVSSPVRVNPAEQMYVTEEILSQPWFAGKLSRDEAETRLKSGGRAGNFLVRQKDDAGRVFVHSYLSLTRMAFIHNLIEFAEDGTCTVDNQVWQHSRAPSLEDVIDKMQEIRRKRKGMKGDFKPNPATAKQLQGVWNHIFQPNEKRGRLSVVVKKMQPGGFMVCRSASAGAGGYCVVVRKKEPGYFTAFIPNSPQGYYLKYSELLASTIKELILAMVENSKGTIAAGLPVPLRIPSVAEASVPLPPKLPPNSRAAPSRGGAPPPLPARPPARASQPELQETYYEADTADDLIYGSGGSDEDDIYGE